MIKATKHSPLILGVMALVFTALTPSRVLAHCDGLDGPVVQAAQRALETRNPASVLIWVQEKDEPEIRMAFEHTLAVRELSAQALADRYFFETVGRVHRAGEGAPFTGLKPPGRDLGPAIPAADEAIHKSSIEPVSQLLTGAVEERLRQQFGQMMARRAFSGNDLAAGRSYVKAYVEFIHFVERLYETTMTTPHGHFNEPDGGSSNH